MILLYGLDLYTKQNKNIVHADFVINRFSMKLSSLSDVELFF